MFVGDLSLKAECGSHTPWHALARPGTPWHALAHASVETCGFPGFHAGHGLDLVLALSCMSYRHAMKSSQAERKRQSSAWTKTETFLSSPTMGRRWLPDAACGCKFGNGSVDHASQPVQHCNCRNRTSKQHRTYLSTHLQSLPMCCCRSVGYFLGALVEVLHSESVVNM